ncbi:NADH dehydrogenase [ubiquinone] 1 beta subcomplex subunit 1 isoform X1 [Phyllostomus discolor]|uniref:NADH dehydrogenase [ubiquinone] 1 beta subcomplex subunit 1 n=2 Tax=Phyllostomus discolor TaxID=89673 RepID=A0A6J2L7W9_9CHIR|nr:NADH dehydrogenase [ubiquinone] 1 beta subcomplex subunit 1 isoform X1 [Phyllostomus discolor]
MVGPRALASAGAGGWARCCPWSWGRFWYRDRRMNLIQLVRDHWVHVLVPMGFAVGWYLDRRNEEKLTGFRNKSLLFKRELRPDEEVTWK